MKGAPFPPPLLLSWTACGGGGPPWAAERRAHSSEGGVGRGSQSEVEQPSCRTSLTAELYREQDGCPTCVRQK